MDKNNLGSYLGQHDIIYNSLPQGWQSGLPIGNGDLASINYRQGQDYCLGITKVDVWDMRFRRKEPIATHCQIMELAKDRDWQGLMHLHDRETKPSVGDFFPSPKPCGKMKIKGVFTSKNNNYQERLSLAQGLISLKRNLADIDSFVDANSNLLVVRYKRKDGKGIDLEFNRWEDKELGEPVFGKDEKYFWVDYTFPDNFHYVMTGRLNTREYKIRKSKNSFLISTNSQKVELYLSVATTLETEKPLQKSKKTIEAGISKGYKKILLKHQQWWQSFWQKSFIDIPDKLLENLWYYSLYLLGSSSRGKFPPPVASSLWHFEDKQPWNGDYHTNINIEMLYWPIFASNHLELGETFYRNFFQVLPKVKEDTKKTFGINGAKYAFCPIPTGEEISRGYWRYEIYVSAWVGQMFWWYWCYSRDREFLDSKAFPVIKEILRFYEGYLQKDNEGRYYLFPCHTPEQVPPDNADKRTKNWEKNVLIDLALLKYLLKSGIKAGKILHQAKQKRILWKKMLDNLSPYPHNEKVFLEFEGAPADFLVHHCAVLSPVFPCYEIGTDSPRELYSMARQTLETICTHTIRKDPHPPFPVPTWNDDCNWPWLAISAAVLGLGDLAKAYLYDMGILFHLKQNGFFTCGFTTQKPAERNKDTLCTSNSGSGLTMAINEMLLQTHDGEIKVFPSLPSDWKDCRFANLRTVGGFLVSSEMENGKVKYFSIISLNGGKCRVVNPWGIEVEIRKVKKGKRVKMKKGDKKYIDFLTEKGRTYFIQKKGDKFQLPSIVLPRSRRRQAPRIYKGPRYLCEFNKTRYWQVQLGK